MVVFVVLLVNVFMIGVCHFWGMAMSHIMAVNMSFALGIAVDYATHIAHTYLHVKAPTDMGLSNGAKREYKARKAISQMGSSVWHGGFSTFLAIVVMAGAQVFTFIVFFKTWFCIILFGMLNGMILLPILLSICGPLGSQDIEIEK